MEGYAAARNAGTDRDREVDVGHRLNVLFLDHRGDLGALLSREFGARRGLSRGGLGLAVRSTLGVRVFAITALSLHAVAVFAAFGLHVLAGGALFIGLRAHALRLFTLQVAVLGGSLALCGGLQVVDRKSTRLNSSHDQISYAVFCLKKKKKK